MNNLCEVLQQIPVKNRKTMIESMGSAKAVGLQKSEKSKLNFNVGKPYEASTS